MSTAEAGQIGQTRVGMEEELLSLWDFGVQINYRGMRQDIMEMMKWEMGDHEVCRRIGLALRLIMPWT